MKYVLLMPTMVSGGAGTMTAHATRALPAGRLDPAGHTRRRRDRGPLPDLADDGRVDRARPQRCEGDRGADRSGPSSADARLPDPRSVAARVFARLPRVRRSRQSG